ncbi:MAG TPA: dihydrodipicolinate synthase family protein [Micromonosporaceae bacterium]|jgi:4-hydroxy-tetrahydrodipicolinate synthase|nr:dihydrodipicolinate synthase family protein [Micromonosporaceae bacterium]
MNMPWHGVLVATALPYRDDLSVDYDAYAAHVRWLVESGCAGVVPNGSLGEYQVLTAQERARVVTVAVEAVTGTGSVVVPGVSAYGSREARGWADQAAEAGCAAVMLLPPNAYRAGEPAVVEHFRAVAAAGLPVVAYNNPIDTKVDLTPALLARLHGDGLIAAVKEFTGDVRRGYEIRELAPGLDVIVGSDDVVVELALAGATGWIAGIPNALPAECVALWDAARSADLAAALPAYRTLHPLLRWDSKTEFVQAIKLAMDLSGRYGGACRPPRLPLQPDQVTIVTDAVALARKG